MENVWPAALLFAEADTSSWPWLPLILGGVGVFIVLLCWLVPVVPFRLFLAVLGRTLYWVSGFGKTNVPRQGPVLLVCHPLHGLDFLWLVVTAPRRVRLLIPTGLTKSWLARACLRWIDAIVIDGDATPLDVEKAIQQAQMTLQKGGVIGLFTGTVILREGLSLSFSRFLEQLQTPNIPVVPVCVDQHWGSRFVAGGKQLRWTWPQHLFYTVEVSFGAASAATTAGDLVHAVQYLSAQAAITRNARRLPVHRQFVRMAARRPFLPCIIDSTLKRELSYGKTLAGAICLARLLRPLLGSAPNVALWLPPGIGGVVSNVALSLLGKTTVNLNYTSSASVIQSALKQSGSRFVITSRRFVGRVALDPGPGVELLFLEDLSPKISKFQQVRAFLAVVLLPGFLLDWSLGLRRHRLTDIATIMFSSGTTGEPKGILLSHGNLAGNVESMIQAARLERHDRILGVLPFFHSFGFTVTLWTPLQLGASTVYHADPRQAREIGELCRTYRCTIYLTTPTFLRFCLRKCDPADFRSLRLLICGAEKLPQSLADEFETRFGVRPLEGYGCTELTPVVAANLPDEEMGGVKRLFNKSGCIGPALAGIVGRFVHPETGEPVAVGEDGLLLVQGPNVMVGYLHRPEMTAQVVRDGWYVTGDMGRQDAEGFLRLTGRLSRFAKVGGEMVPLERIEDELHAILETSERICAVTCIPDEARGERLVVLHQQAAGLEIRLLCQQLGGRGLPNLWLPSERDFIPVPDLPVLGSGKVNLQRVKELALELSRR